MKKIILLLCFFIIGKIAIAKDCVFVSSNKCYTCDDYLSFEIGEWRLCEKYCPNRGSNVVGMGVPAFTANCALKECPNEAPLRDERGSCYPCDTVWQYILDFDIQNCNVCPNRYTDENGNCLIKGQAPLKHTWEQYKNEPYGNDDTICPKDKPLKSWNNLCFSCNTKEEVRVATNCNFEKEKECNEVCDNREILGTIGGNPPSVLKCPQGKPLMDTVGMCWSCDTAEIINVKYNEWKCQSICGGKRFISGDVCLKCPNNKNVLDYDTCQKCKGEWQDGKCKR